MRLIKSIIRDETAARIYYCHRHQEYVVKIYYKGMYVENADYFTDCRQDAIATAKAMLAR
jgi:hypothetical protein